MDGLCSPLFNQWHLLYLELTAFQFLWFVRIEYFIKCPYTSVRRQITFIDHYDFIYGWTLNEMTTYSFKAYAIVKSCCLTRRSLKVLHCGKICGKIIHSSKIYFFQYYHISGTQINSNVKLFLHWVQCDNYLHGCDQTHQSTSSTLVFCVRHLEWG